MNNPLTAEELARSPYLTGEYLTASERLRVKATIDALRAALERAEEGFASNGLYGWAKEVRAALSIGVQQ